MLQIENLSNGKQPLMVRVSKDGKRSIDLYAFQSIQSIGNLRKANQKQTVPIKNLFRKSF